MSESPANDDEFFQVSRFMGKRALIVPSRKTVTERLEANDSPIRYNDDVNSTRSIGIQTHTESRKKPTCPEIRSDGVP